MYIETIGCYGIEIPLHDAVIDLYIKHEIDFQDFIMDLYDNISFKDKGGYEYGYIGDIFVHGIKGNINTDGSDDSQTLIFSTIEKQGNEILDLRTDFSALVPSYNNYFDNLKKLIPTLEINYNDCKDWNPAVEEFIRAIFKAILEAEPGFFIYEQAN